MCVLKPKPSLQTLTILYFKHIYNYERSEFQNTTVLINGINHDTSFDGNPMPTDHCPGTGVGVVVIGTAAEVDTTVVF